MVRLFLGLGCGVMLTVCSVGFAGVGHGTYAPLILTTSLIGLLTVFGAATMLVCGPILWAVYFLLIPKLEKKRTRLATALLVLAFHVISGTWLAVEDPAFWKVLAQQSLQLIFFGLFFALSSFLLLYLAARGDTGPEVQE